MSSPRARGTTVIDTDPRSLRLSQGYAFKVITSLDGLESLPGLVYPTKEEQIELLQSVLVANESDADIGGDVRGDEGGSHPRSGASKNAGGSAVRRNAAVPKADRVAGSLNALSGYVPHSLCFHMGIVFFLT